MKFTCFVDIHLPRKQVVQLFNSRAHLKKWQDGFQSFEALSGVPGEVGSTAKLIYIMRGKPMELIEKITVNKLPSERSANYEHVHMNNSMRNLFSELNGGQVTRYTAEVEYTAFKSVPVKIMAKLFPGMFKKQVQKWMNQFKTFAEGAEHFS